MTNTQVLAPMLMVSLTLVVTAIGSNLAFLLEIPFAGPSHQRFHNPARAFHGLCTYPVYTNEVLN